MSAQSMSTMRGRVVLSPRWLSPQVKEGSVMDTTVKRDTVTITYNGNDKIIGYRPDEKVRAVLDWALAEFHVASNPHLMGLFTEGNAELPDDCAMRAAGVKPGELLVLRLSAVRGGRG